MKTNRRQFLTASTILPASIAVGSVAAAESEAAGDADIGFCQDMSVHHLQALAMCQRVLGRNTGDSVQAAAAEVLQNQAMEVGQMRAWLTDWGASTVPPERVMAWMGANQGTGIPISMMPGYASEEQLAELSTLDGRARGRRWLELMRAHHEGGVMMAKQAQILASSGKVVRLAKFQVTAQSYEISIYDMLLAQSYTLD